MTKKWGAEEWSAVAAGFSALTAAAAVWITVLQRSAPYQQSLYEERWRSYNEFARSSSRFSASLADAGSSITKNVDSEIGLAKMTQADLLEVSKPAADVLRAERRFTEEASGLVGPWPEAVKDYFLATDRAKSVAIRCYKLLGVHGDDLRDRSDWWNYVRSEARTECKDIHKGEAARAFSTSSRATLAAMRNAIRLKDNTLTP